MFLMLSMLTGMGLIASLLLYVGYYVLLVLGMWFLFAKAGIPGWKSIIPIYNFYILFKISWTSSMFWIWVLLFFLTNMFDGAAMDGSSAMNMLASFCDIALNVVQLMLWYKVSQAYGHGLGYAIGLWILNPIFIMILGLGSSRYHGPRYA